MYKHYVISLQCYFMYTLPVLFSYNSSLLGVALFHFAALCHFPFHWLANLYMLLPNYLLRNSHIEILAIVFLTIHSDIELKCIEDLNTMRKVHDGWKKENSLFRPNS